MCMMFEQSFAFTIGMVIFAFAGSILFAINC